MSGPDGSVTKRDQRRQQRLDAQRQTQRARQTQRRRAIRRRQLIQVAIVLITLLVIALVAFAVVVHPWSHAATPTQSVYALLAVASAPAQRAAWAPAQLIGQASAALGALRVMAPYEIAA